MTLLAGGVLASLVLGGVAVLATREGPDPAPTAIASPAAPAALVPPPARASRAGIRTALPQIRYVRRTVATGRSFSGLASWYGPRFHGRRTASGERFDSRALTAASPTLAFGTRLRVCRAGRCVIVRVNDRGPYVHGRVLDLSRAARNELGGFGVARVTATPVRTRRVAVPTRRPVPIRRPVPVRAASAVVPRPLAAVAPAGSSFPVGRTSAVCAGGLTLAACAIRLRHLRR